MLEDNLKEGYWLIVVIAIMHRIEDIIFASNDETEKLSQNKSTVTRWKTEIVVQN